MAVGLVRAILCPFRTALGCVVHRQGLRVALALVTQCLIGLNLLTEVSVRSGFCGDADIMCTSQFDSAQQFHEGFAFRFDGGATSTI